MCEYVTPPNVEEVRPYEAPESTDVDYDEDTNTITVYVTPDNDDDDDDVPEDKVGEFIDAVGDILEPFADALSNRSSGDDDDEDDEESSDSESPED